MKKILSIFIMILSLSFAFTLTSCDKEVDLSGVVFSDATYDYDGEVKSLVVENLPEGLTVEYLFNGQKDPGTYRVIATILDEDGEVVGEMAAMLIIIAPKEPTPTPTPIVKTYTVTYDTKGHGEAPASVKEATKLPAELPVLTAEGYTFDGWFTDEALSVAAVAGSTITANTTLYAKWTEVSEPTPAPETYIVTYNVNGHGEAPASLTEVTALPTELPVLTADGYTFDGWYLDEELTVAAVAGSTITANTTLYAKWTEVEDQQSGDPVVTTYTVEINGVSYPLVENTATTLLETQTGEYMALGLTVAVGDTVVFKKDGTVITEQIGSDPESTTSINNIDSEYKVKASGTVDLYFKTWQDGGHSFWMTGYQAPTSGGDDTSIEEGIITIYFQNNWKWTDVKVYLFGPNESSSEWPGSSAECIGQDGEGDLYDIYKVEVNLSQYTGIIFSGVKNDGSGYRDQTPDITLDASLNGTCYYMVWNDKNEVGTYIYTE